MTNLTLKSASAVTFKMTLLSVLFFFNQIMFASNPNPKHISEVQTGTITSNSAVIAFQLPYATTDSIKIIWSIDKKNWSSVVINAGETFVQISNILPHTKYYYKVFTKMGETTTAMSPTYAFITPAEKRENAQDIASAQ
jgi:hypothetical protein